MKTLSRFAFLPLALLLASCANNDETIPVDKTGEMMKPKLVGRVATVPSDKRFVLIQSYGNWNVPAGTILISHGADHRTANLLVTGEAMGQYAAADLQGGEVAVGDAVYSRELTRPDTPAPEPTPPSIDISPPDL